MDVKKGVHHPLSVIIREGGGSSDPESVRAAVRYVVKCVQMGGKFRSFNRMTERWEYLYFKTEVIEEFRQSWATFSSWRS